MTSRKKERMSMLDKLATAGSATPGAAASMITTNRALRSARDAVDGHHVWELDPSQIDDNRPVDRLETNDIEDLRLAIETNGQTVPILVRRQPSQPDRYLLVYGRRKLEAIRRSDKVSKIRALIATLDESAAVRAQVSENMARRDLTYIEKALFARELVRSGFGNQSEVAEVLTMSKSAISMALGIVDTVGEDLIRAIGPAPGAGRPRWEALGKCIEATGSDRTELQEIASGTVEKTAAATDNVTEGGGASLRALETVETILAQKAAHKQKATPDEQSRTMTAASRPLVFDGTKIGSLRKNAKGLTIALSESDFSKWLEAEAHEVLNELYVRWKSKRVD
ncbi:plasmid partitioning protein RepB (plasmid) [Shimia sp. W99]